MCNTLIFIIGSIRDWFFKWYLCSVRVQKEQVLGYELTSEVIQDKKFASILSPKNEIAFKDGMIYQANHDFCFLVESESYSLIDEFRKQGYQGEISLEKDGSFKFKQNLTVFSTIQESKLLNLKDRRDRYFESRHRLQGDTKRKNYFIYRYIRALTHAKRKKWFWWTGEDIDQIRVSGQANLIYIEPLFGEEFRVPVTFNDNRINDDKVTSTLNWAAGQGDALGVAQFPRVEGTATHFGNRNGSTLTFTTSW